MSSLPAYQVRPATAQDAAFLARLYASTRAEELEWAGFPLDQREAFCRMQFNARQHHYAQHYARAEDIILEIDGRAIGRELILYDEDELLLVDVALLPEFRNRGIGSHRLRHLIDRSRCLRCPIRLCVEQLSRARDLYLRHGFVVIDEAGIHLRMERLPDAIATGETR